MIPRDELAKMGYEIEVLIVDGRSTDNTKEIAKSRGARVIDSLPGYGRQYKLGFENATGEIIVTADSDCSYPMKDIPGLLNIFRRNSLEFLTTNRFANLEANSMRLTNRIGNYGLTCITNLLYGLHLKDSQSGMWVITKNALNKVELLSTRMSFSQEIKIKAFQNLRSMEVDSSYKKRVGKSKLRIFRDGFENTLFLLLNKISK